MEKTACRTNTMTNKKKIILIRSLDSSKILNYWIETKNSKKEYIDKDIFSTNQKSDWAEKINDFEPACYPRAIRCKKRGERVC
ncbi:hypothetical protein RIF29_43222 [Crotalaria pallida]|uniref:Uncharacterized protein n=1 Tax=Crotalaria pallida TaxID=3830 RepID=A0AAN9DY27_CROPI